MSDHQSENIISYSTLASYHHHLILSITDLLNTYYQIADLTLSL